MYVRIGHCGWQQPRACRAGSLERHGCIEDSWFSRSSPASLRSNTAATYEIPTETYHSRCRPCPRNTSLYRPFAADIRTLETCENGHNGGHEQLFKA